MDCMHVCVMYEPGVCKGQKKVRPPGSHSLSLCFIEAGFQCVALAVLEL